MWVLIRAGLDHWAERTDKHIRDHWAKKFVPTVTNMVVDGICEPDNRCLFVNFRTNMKAGPF